MDIHEWQLMLDELVDRVVETNDQEFAIEALHAYDHARKRMDRIQAVPPARRDGEHPVTYGNNHSRLDLGFGVLKFTWLRRGCYHYGFSATFHDPAEPIRWTLELKDNQSRLSLKDARGVELAHSLIVVPKEF